MRQTYKKLRERFENEVEELRKECKHEKLSEWIPQMWALAHSTGFEVKVCKRCEKVVEKRERSGSFDVI